MTTLDRFLATWRALDVHAGVFGPAPSTRATQAALLVLCNAEHLADEVPDALRQMREASGFFSNLNNALGQSLVSLALAEGQHAGLIPAREKALRVRFKAHGMPHLPGLWTCTTAAWLSLLPDDEVEAALPRMAAIMRRWKEDHPWLTGADDLHTAALHALGREDVERIGLRTEDRYKILEGFGPALNTRQRVAQLTALRPELSPELLVGRMQAIRRAFQGEGRHMWFRSLEPLALLALADGDAYRLGIELDRTLGELEGELKWVGDSLRFLLAAGLVTGEHRPAAGQSPLQGALLAVMVAAVQAQHAAAASAGAG